MSSRARPPPFAVPRCTFDGRRVVPARSCAGCFRRQGCPAEVCIGRIPRRSRPDSSFSKDSQKGVGERGVGKGYDMPSRQRCRAAAAAAALCETRRAPWVLQQQTHTLMVDGEGGLMAAVGRMFGLTWVRVWTLGRDSFGWLPRPRRWREGYGNAGAVRDQRSHARLGREA